MGVEEFVDGAAVVDIEEDMAMSLTVSQSLCINLPSWQMQLFSDKLDKWQG
jgi:hypothetical protein